MDCNGLVCYSCNGMIHSQYVQLKLPTEDEEESHVTFHAHCYLCIACKKGLSGISPVFYQSKVYCSGKCATATPTVTIVTTTEVIEEVPEPAAPTEEPEVQIPEPLPVPAPEVKEIPKAPVVPIGSHRKKFTPSGSSEGYPWLISEGDLTESEAELILLEKNIPGSYFVYKPESDRPKDYVLAFL